MNINMKKKEERLWKSGVGTFRLDGHVSELKCGSQKGAKSFISGNSFPLPKNIISSMKFS
jgi:hypothetical protein